jgi:hypothetical protein
MEAVYKRASAWTEKRESELVTLVQAFERAITVSDAEGVWEGGLMKPIFRYVDRKVIKERPQMIRRLCAEEDVIEGGRSQMLDNSL